MANNDLCGRSSSSSSYRSARKRSRERDPLSVADVYDIAADIGREFEALIDSHGAEHVTQLMQKVISALEHLEQLSGDREKEKVTIDNLQTLVKHLELEDSKKLEERQRNAKELEQVEEHYKQETRDLLSTVKRLQDENRKLSSSLAAANERDSAFSEDETYFEVDLVNKLETVIEKQRSQIKKLDQSGLDYRTENDELRCQNEKLTACTRDLRRKFRSTQCQMHSLVDERADLTAKTQDQQREIHYLTKQLGLVAKECEDLSGVQSQIEQKPPERNASGEDPDRPRFSLPELRDILQERNSLKARVSDLEDELTIFRPGDKNALSGVSSPSRSPRVRLAEAVANCDCAFHSKGEKHDHQDDEDDEDSDIEEAIECDEMAPEPQPEEEEEDPPVQGPLPQDPEDAPFMRNESGIRKLFRKVFGGGRGGTKVSYDEGYVDRCLVKSSSSNNATSQDGIARSISRFSFLVASRGGDD